MRLGEFIVVDWAISLVYHVGAFRAPVIIQTGLLIQEQLVLDDSNIDALILRHLV
jgi:hypothetical protein